MKTIHVYDRGVIMRRAWAIARQRRDELARRAYDANVRVVGSRIIRAKPFEAFLVETPLDLGAAQKAAWAEARRVDSPHNAENASVALMIVRQGALAPLRRRLRGIRVWSLLVAGARALNRHFIPSRAA
jgi:hypothetical protein